MPEVSVQRNMALETNACFVDHPSKCGRSGSSQPANATATKSGVERACRVAALCCGFRTVLMKRALHKVLSELGLQHRHTANLLGAIVLTVKTLPTTGRLLVRPEKALCAERATIRCNHDRCAAATTGLPKARCSHPERAARECRKWLGSSPQENEKHACKPVIFTSHSRPTVCEGYLATPRTTCGDASESNNCARGKEISNNLMISKVPVCLCFPNFDHPSLMWPDLVLRSIVVGRSKPMLAKFCHRATAASDGRPL